MKKLPQDKALFKNQKQNVFSGDPIIIKILLGSCFFFSLSYAGIKEIGDSLFKDDKAILLNCISKEKKKKAERLGKLIGQNEEERNKDIDREKKKKKYIFIKIWRPL